MNDTLALSDIKQDGTPIETPDLIEIPAVLAFAVPPVCPSCGNPMRKNGVEQVRVMDAPIRGKRVVLDLRKERRRCRGCKMQRTATSPNLRLGYRVLTRRLVRYVENRVVKITVEEVARETGLTPDLVRDLAVILHDRLRRHPTHWATPVAVAVDNIQTAPGWRFQVLFDQIANRPMAIAPTWGLDPIAREVRRALDPQQVRVFSTDMSQVNLDLADLFTNAIHVADKFHVFDVVNKGVSAVIRQRVAALTEAGDDAAATQLRGARRALLGEADVIAPQAQMDLDLEPLPDDLDRHADVAAAHRVRRQLMRFYASTGPSEARSHLDELYDRMRQPGIADAVRDALGYVHNHDRQVFAYFEALDLMGRDLWSPTTNALEQRNSNLQKIWRSARGYGDSPLFGLRAVYHPYTFGLHLVDCAKCDGFVGPLSMQETLDASQSTHQTRRLCNGCATPQSAESSMSSPEHDVAARREAAAPA